MTQLTGALEGLAPWSAAELRVLRYEYARGGIHAARAALPDRSAQSIYKRAHRLKVRRRRWWTPADDARLRALWSAGDTTLKEIAEALERTTRTVYQHAKELGLKLGCPDGWEYLTDAAARTGYCTAQLRPILAWAGVGLYPARARPSKRRGPRGGARRATWIVWPSDVDDAIARWHETEWLNAAARRVGVCAETLARRLRALGIEKPVAGKKRWRVHGDDVRRAMAKRGRAA